MRNSRNPHLRGQTGHLNEIVLVEVEGLCEAFKKTFGESSCIYSPGASEP